MVAVDMVSARSFHVRHGFQRRAGAGAVFLLSAVDPDHAAGGQRRDRGVATEAEEIADRMSFRCTCPLIRWITRNASATAAAPIRGPSTPALGMILILRAVPEPEVALLGASAGAIVFIRGRRFSKPMRSGPEQTSSG